MPKSSLGQPGPGWGFTVVLTGQDTELDYTVNQPVTLQGVLIP